MTELWFPPGLKRLPLAAIDFEASRLPGKGSYPIEVAVVHEDGRSRSWLIRPRQDWLVNGEWDPQSEAVHGIGMETLLAEGLGAATVAAELLAELAGTCAVSDHSADQKWLEALCATAGRTAPLLAGMDDFYFGWLLERGGCGEEGMDAITALMDAAQANNPIRHRAASDAGRLMDFLKAIMREPVPGQSVPGQACG